MRFGRTALAIAAYAAAACDSLEDVEFVRVELRMRQLDERGRTIHVYLSSRDASFGLANLEHSIDDTIGARVDLQVRKEWVPIVEVKVFDEAKTPIQQGRIASAGPADADGEIWTVTLVGAANDPVVCDEIDNDGNGEIDEQGCAE